jgi:tetratricopeptide (TPR) repeat protein
MRWLLSEYLLKGVYLGLLLFVALQQPDWQSTGEVATFVGGGLALALAIAAAGKLREGYRVRGRLAPFILFLFLESPGLVYGGVLLGLALGAFAIRAPEAEQSLMAFLAGGAVLGLLFCLLRQVSHRWIRLGLSLALGIGLVAAALYVYYHQGLLERPEQRTMFGVRLLLGIPVFYILTFAGIAEESEIEIGAMCAALGLGAWMLTRDHPTYQNVAVLIPIVLYFLYTLRVLPALRVFKHVVRGISHAKVGRYRPALIAFRRALQLDPANHLARESLWAMHRGMDLAQVAQDPATLELVDVDLCLERARTLLLEPRPGADKLQEAHHLLDLVLSQRPQAQPAVRYWRAVAWTHARDIDRAVRELQPVLDAGREVATDPARESVLFVAWQLTLLLHPELNRRLGAPQLTLPGRRLHAIGAVERRLGSQPDDAAVWELKRLLYSNLTESEYTEATGGNRAAADFDHGYVEQLGLALIDDPARWQRGVEFLRLAARGLLARAPVLFQHIAQAYQRAGQNDAVWNYYELAKRAGQSVGPKNLGETERQAYFAAVKTLAERARAGNDLDAAIQNYQLYTESERSGLETLRTLAELYERNGDVLGALRVTEQGLIYNGKDKDLLDRKDRYYYSLLPAQLESHVEAVRSFFDIVYCLRKSRALLDLKDADLDVIDWALHLAELAGVIQPDSLAAQVLRARALRRKGETDQVLAILEHVYQQKADQLQSSADQEAWFTACRMLGEMYLYELSKPELAVACFTDYRKSSRSGADTLYKLGQAYEQLGDRARATKCYEHVTAYDGHPLASDAHDALYRLRVTAGG